MTTLDNLLEKLDIEKVDLLKTNVEGAELAVLDRCKKLLTIGEISKIVATPHPPFEQEAEKSSGILRHLVTGLRLLMTPSSSTHF